MKTFFLVSSSNLFTPLQDAWELIGICYPRPLASTHISSIVSPPRSIISIQLILGLPLLRFPECLASTPDLSIRMRCKTIPCLLSNLYVIGTWLNWFHISSYKTWSNLLCSVISFKTFILDTTNLLLGCGWIAHAGAIVYCVLAVWSLC